MARLLARAARWSLPAALLVATLVAAVGLGGLLFPESDAPPPAPNLALNLSSAPALPAPDDTTALTPQQLPLVTPHSACPEVPRSCSHESEPVDQADCCR